MRKKIVAILLAATMAIGITACGNQSESNKDDNTITVWCWDKTFNIFAMEEAAKIYQEDHQGVKIDIVEVGDVWNAYVGSLNMYIAYRLSILYFTEEFCRRYYWSCKIINDIYKERD